MATDVDLKLGVNRYNPEANYLRVRDKLFGGDITDSD